MSPKEGNFERWNLTHLDCISNSAAVQGCEDAQSEAKMLDFMEAPFDLCSDLICAGAVAAGLYKSQHLGCPEVLEAAFPRAETNVSNDLGYVGGNSMGLGKDPVFVSNVFILLELVQSLGRTLLPAHLTDGSAMKGLRGMLVTAQQNADRFDWWVNCKEDYTSLGLDYLDVDGAFVPLAENHCGWCHPVTSKAIGFCDWTGLSIKSLGQIIWQWISCAHYDVIETGL